MATRTLFLVAFRPQNDQRAHFSIFVPSANDPAKGTLIHVVSNPMRGFQLEFKRNYSLDDTRRTYTKIAIGDVYADNIVDSAAPEKSTDATPTRNIEIAATQVQPPKVSQNFMAPVDGIKNRRCQEWTIDYVRRLVDCTYLDQSAIDIVQSQRDPPSFGVGLKAAGRGGGQAVQAAAGPAYPTPQQSVAVPAQQPTSIATQGSSSAKQTTHEWVWHESHKKYAYWDGTRWVWQDEITIAR